MANESRPKHLEYLHWTGIIKPLHKYLVVVKNLYGRVYQTVDFQDAAGRWGLEIDKVAYIIDVVEEVLDEN